MADNDLELHVRTTADLEAIKQAQDAVDDLAERTRKMSADWRETGTLKPSPHLLETGQPFGSGFGGAGVSGLTSVAADTQRAEQAALGFGMNLARARNEAVILAREIATGTVSMRTLSSLLGSLGAPFAVAGVEAMVVVQALRKSNEEAAKFNEELKKQTETVTTNADKWRELAETATSPELRDALVGQMVPALEQMNAKLREVNEKQLSMKQHWIENIAVMDKLIALSIGWNPQWFDSKMYQKGLDQTKQFFGQLSEMQLDAQRQALQTADIMEKAFEADKLRPTAEVIDELNRKIDTFKFLIASLPDPFGADLKTAQEYTKQLESIQKELGTIQNMDQQRHKTADDAYGKADESVKRVLMNEKAATEARQAGQEKDAEMYSKSAEQYAAGLNPAQQQQLSQLRELQRQAYGGPGRTGPMTPQEQIDANKRAFDEYWARPDVRAAMGDAAGPRGKNAAELNAEHGGRTLAQEIADAVGAKLDRYWGN